jgi:acyl carrier protein
MDYLTRHNPAAALVRGVPNARTALDGWVLQQLDRKWNTERVRDIRYRVPVGVGNLGIDPEEWWSLAGESSYDLELTWSPLATDGRYDVLFTRRGSGVGRRLRRGDIRDLKNHANDPLRPFRRKELIARLRAYVAQHLPAYMMPAFWVLMDALPLNANGKINAAALPLPEPVIRRAPMPTFDSSPILSGLRAIWEQVLGVGGIQAHENFFHLGGDSLAAIQLAARVGETFDVSVSPVTVFEAPTLAQMAAVLEVSAEDQASRGEQAAKRGRTRRELSRKAIAANREDAE